MLLGFALGVVVLWGSLLIRQGKALQTDVAAKKAMLKKQQDTLNQKPGVMTKIAYYQDKFKTSVSSTELVNRVTAYGRDAQVPTPAIQSSRNDSNKKDSIFNVNAVTVHFVKTPFRSLVDFTSRVLADKPYLIIDELTMQPDRTDPHLMTGDVQVWALELKPGALDVSATPSAIK